MLDLLALYAVFSLPFTFAKAALQYAQPLFLAGSRMLLAGGALIGYQYYLGKSPFGIKKEHISLFLQAIIIQVYVMYVCYTWSLQYITSGKSALIFALAPFITAVICYIVLSEKLTFKKLCGLTIGFLGFLPTLMTGNATENLFGRIGFLSWPEIGTIIAVTCYAYGWIISKKLMRLGYSPFTINGISMLFGGVLIMFTSPIIDCWTPWPFTQFWPFFGYTLVLVIISNIISYNWYIFLLKKYSATFISFGGFTEPLFVAFYSWIFLGETVNWQFFVSLAIISLGLYIFYQEELRQGYTDKIK